MASLPLDSSPKTSINFRSLPHHTATKEIQWSDSTDIGDFVKEAAQDREFSITISSPALPATSSPPSEKKENDESKNKPNETNIRVLVPSFKARTRFLRHRLGTLSAELSKLEKIKRDCDHVAHRSARRLALGGFGLLLVYFGVVARLTFWDLGWCVKRDCILKLQLITESAGGGGFLGKQGHYGASDISIWAYLDYRRLHVVPLSRHLRFPLPWRAPPDITLAL